MPAYPMVREEFVRIGSRPKRRLDPIQPKALLTLNRKATEYADWLTAYGNQLVLEDPHLTDSLTHFCWFKGYTEIDVVDLRGFLLGTIPVGIDETPPDPPAEPEESELEDPFGD